MWQINSVLRFFISQFKNVNNETIVAEILFNVIFSTCFVSNAKTQAIGISLIE